MTDRMKKWLGAALVTFVALVVYSMTMAPTVSFWDCGEFIAASHTLGIPHPPGTPLFLLIGRAAIILFQWFGSEAVRMNWLSALSSAMTVGVVYLMSWRAIWLIQNAEERKTEGWVRTIGAGLGALLLTFSDTFWFSAVEAEVYGAAMFVTMLTALLALEWIELRKTPWGDRLLVLIVYLAFTGVGMHLYTVMFVPVVFLLVVTLDADKRRMWPLYITGLLLLSIIYATGKFQFIALGLLAVTALFWALPVGAPRRAWKLCATMTFVALIGWSSHLVIPIRSALDPQIDENDPEIRPQLVLGKPETYDNLRQHSKLSYAFDVANWKTFQDFVERKQYGDESMLARAFTRRGQLFNQFLTYENMGYGGYFVQQLMPFKVGRETERLGMTIPSQMQAIGVRSAPDKDNRYQSTGDGVAGRRFLQLFLFVLAHLPIYYLLKFAWFRNRNVALFLALLYVFTSFGLVVYMNFADGTRPEVRDAKEWVRARQGGYQGPYPSPVHLEVRERDYFFTPAFILAMALYGMGGAFALSRLRRAAKPAARKWGFASVAVLLGASPVFAAWANWHEHDRSGNYVPWDYSYNLLMSCDKDGILFTNGDNDTFPLWYLQEVEGVRKDVRVVNLSLINTDWYIRQMRDLEPKVPIRMTDAAVLSMQPEQNPYQQPVMVEVGKRPIQLPGADRKPYFMIQDKMILHIVDENSRLPKPRPVHFAATVGDDNLVGLAPYVQMKGLVLTLRDQPPQEAVDVEGSRELFEKTYKFRGLGDPSIYFDDDTQRLLRNYSALAIQIAMEALPGMQRLRAEEMTGAADSSAAGRQRTDSLRREVDARMKSPLALLRRAEEMMPGEWRVPYYASELFLQLGRNASAESTLTAARKRQPTEPMIAVALAESKLQAGKRDEALALYKEAAATNPKDTRIAEGYARALADAGRTAEALQALDAALRSNPGDQRLAGLRQMISERVNAAPAFPGAPAQPGIPGPPAPQGVPQAPAPSIPVPSSAAPAPQKAAPPSASKTTPAPAPKAPPSMQSAPKAPAPKAEAPSQPAAPAPAPAAPQPAPAPAAAPQ